MKYRALTPQETEYAHEQLYLRTKEENMAYWYFPTTMKAGMKRNYPIAFEGCDTAYYPDFVLFDERIIIEIDGGYHNGKKQIERDEKKDQVFQNNDFAVIRIKNEDTSVNVSSVILVWLKPPCRFIRLDMLISPIFALSFFRGVVRILFVNETRA